MAPTETPSKVATPAVRTAYANEVGAVKSAVGTLARKAETDALALALRALLRQSYRPVGATVQWAQPEHRTAHGEGCPDNGAAMRDMVKFVVSALPTGKAADEQATTERKAAREALTALGKALA